MYYIMISLVGCNCLQSSESSSFTSGDMEHLRFFLNIVLFLYTYIYIYIYIYIYLIIYIYIYIYLIIHIYIYIYIYTVFWRIVK